METKHLKEHLDIINGFKKSKKKKKHIAIIYPIIFSLTGLIVTGVYLKKEVHVKENCHNCSQELIDFLNRKNNDYPAYQVNDIHRIGHMNVIADNADIKS